MEHFLRYAKYLKEGDILAIGSSGRPFKIERWNSYKDGRIEIRMSDTTTDKLYTIYALPDDLFETRMVAITTPSQ